MGKQEVKASLFAYIYIFLSVRDPVDSNQKVFEMTLPCQTEK